MLFQTRKVVISWLCLLALSSAAQALEAEGWNTAHTEPWPVGDAAVIRRVKAPAEGYSLNRTQTWANGLASSNLSAFTPSNVDRTVGAKMQPFQEWNFMIGTELTRSGGESRFLASKAMWESFWSRDVETLGGLEIGLSTVGSVDNAQTDYLQSFSGRVSVPLDLPLNSWRMELRATPSMNVDVSNGTLSSHLMSEIMGQTELSSQDAAFRSTLNVSVGYSLAPDTRPAEALMRGSAAIRAE
jgi:hypothetical protein